MTFYQNLHNHIGIRQHVLCSDGYLQDKKVSTEGYLYNFRSRVTRQLIEYMKLSADGIDCSTPLSDFDEDFEDYTSENFNCMKGFDFDFYSIKHNHLIPNVVVIQFLLGI